MRLLTFDSQGELFLTEDLTSSTTEYAILSHTWGKDDEEVTFQDLKDGGYKSKVGYAKIQFCGEQAQRDGLSYFWVDTCCIDQTNQAELTEAITSMFRWYHQAIKCYVYLSDVEACECCAGEKDPRWKSAFHNSRWFTRGWTLQELLAPRHVEFYSQEWKSLGTKVTLQRDICQVTQIPLAAIQGADLLTFSVQERMQWARDRNTKKPEDAYYCLLGIFDVYMPLIYGEGGNALIRLKEEIIKSFARDLEKIVQTPSASNPHYSRFAATSARRTAPSNPITRDLTSLHEYRQDLLASMRFDQIDSRRETVKTAYVTTCAWVLVHPAYREWVDSKRFDQHCGFLWINGKPGVGKSTLMKFAYANAERGRLAGEILVSFFFNARGEGLEKSTIGMYRSLLFQVLDKAPDLQIVLDKFHRSSRWSVRTPAWTIETLQDLFSSVVSKLSQRHIRCFIDALDECDEQQVQEMIFFFEELGRHALENGTQLHICFASRHYPTIDIRDGLHLTLEDEFGHGQDLMKYVQSHLRAGRGNDVEQVTTQILKKANGVFMWAVLVIPILNKEYRNGRIFAVQKRLQEIPPELRDLFKHILRRDEHNMADFLLCLQWLLYGTRSLRLEEFYFAMVAGLDSEPENLSEWNPQIITVERMRHFVHSSSKGLAELTKTEVPQIQFIHESVRDFLIGDNGMCELWPELTVDLCSRSHDQLKRCCQNYMSICASNHASIERESSKTSLPDLTNGAGRPISIKFPFLQYAVRNVFHHANEAAKKIPQDAFLMSFPLSDWVKLSNLFGSRGCDYYTSKESLLYLLAEHHCARLMTVMLYSQSSSLRARGEFYHFPILAAFANCQRDAIRRTLKLENKKQVDKIIEDLRLDAKGLIRSHETPLLWAIRRGRDMFAKILISLIDSEASTDLDDANVQVHGANFEAKDRSGRTALLCAAMYGKGDILLSLIMRGADIEARDVLGNSALLLAAMSGHHTIVELLVNNGLGIEDGDMSDKSALILAAMAGHEAVVGFLLSRKAKIEAKDLSGRTALSWAAANGHGRVVQLLLDENAATEVQDNLGRTPLLSAVVKGKKMMVQMLLQQGANIEAEDNDKNTALRLAIGGRYSIAELLISHGASITAPGKDGYTPIARAVRDRIGHVISAMFECNTDVGIRNHIRKVLTDSSHRDFASRYLQRYFDS